LIRHFGLIGVVSPAVRQYREWLGFDLRFMKVSESKACGMKESHVGDLGVGNEAAFDEMKISRDRSKEYTARFILLTASPVIIMSDQAAISRLQHQNRLTARVGYL
jgi:hypothetical protein